MPRRHIDAPLRPQCAPLLCSHWRLRWLVRGLRRPAQPARVIGRAVIAAAREYLGANYVLGAEGPVFDCSGLVFRVFADTGDLPRVGGMRLRAAGYMRWFMARGLYSRDALMRSVGDLVVWNNGEHIGLYLGDGKALSALVQPWGVPSTACIRSTCASPRSCM